MALPAKGTTRNPGGKAKSNDVRNDAKKPVKSIDRIVAKSAEAIRIGAKSVDATMIGDRSNGTRSAGNDGRSIAGITEPTAVKSVVKSVAPNGTTSVVMRAESNGVTNVGPIVAIIVTIVGTTATTAGTTATIGADTTTVQIITGIKNDIIARAIVTTTAITIG